MKPPSEALSCQIALVDEVHAFTTIAGGTVVLRVSEYTHGRAPSLRTLPTLQAECKQRSIGPEQIVVAMAHHEPLSWVVLWLGILVVIAVSIMAGLTTGIYAAAFIVFLCTVLAGLRSRAVTISLEVRCESQEQVRDVLDIAVSFRGVQIQGIQWRSECATESVSAAEAACFARVQQRALVLARASGRSQVRLQSVHELPDPTERSVPAGQYPSEEIAKRKRSVGFGSALVGEVPPVERRVRRMRWVFVAEESSTTAG